MKESCLCPALWMSHVPLKLCHEWVMSLFSGMNEWCLCPPLWMSHVPLKLCHREVISLLWGMNESCPCSVAHLLERRLFYRALLQKRRLSPYKRVMSLFWGTNESCPCQVMSWMSHVPLLCHECVMSLSCHVINESYPCSVAWLSHVTVLWHKWVIFSSSLQCPSSNVN